MSFGTMLPDAWTLGKRPAQQRGAPAARDESAKRQKQVKFVPANSTQLRCMLEKLKTQAPETAPRDLMTESISMLDMLPMIDSLNMIPKMDTEQIPVVTRVYEERYMRETKNKSEKACVMGNQCECMFLDSANQFVCMQFEIPDVTSSSAGMCIICLRKCTTLLFYKTLYNGLDPKCVIQRHGNICNKENEYHPSAMLSCPVNGPLQSMPLPIVAHQRNRYEVVISNGIKHVKQLGVYMEDF
jgi:hypothetical protein